LLLSAITCTGILGSILIAPAIPDFLEGLGGWCGTGAARISPPSTPLAALLVLEYLVVSFVLAPCQ